MLRINCLRAYIGGQVKSQEKPQSLRRWEAESEILRAGGSNLGEVLVSVLLVLMCSREGSLCWIRCTRAYRPSVTL